MMDDGSISGRKPGAGELLETVADLVNQFAYRTDDDFLHDGGLSALEGAFDVLRRAGVLTQVREDREWYTINWNAATVTGEVLRCDLCGDVCCGTWGKDGLTPIPCQHHGEEHNHCGGNFRPATATPTTGNP